jgi:hypothetical protein
MKMHGLKSNLIYNPTVYRKEITQAGYQVTKHPAQCTRTIKNEKMMRKTPPINSTKDRFPVIPQALNRHYRDQEGSTNIKSHPTTTRPRKQGKEN